MPADHAFDPFSPFVADNGLEYAHLGDYITSRPVVCQRNWAIAQSIAWHNTVASPDHPDVRRQSLYLELHKLYHLCNRDSEFYADPAGATGRPQFWGRFGPGRSGASGNGGADTGPAPAAAVREAGEPEVRRRVGA